MLVCRSRFVVNNSRLGALRYVEVTVVFVLEPYRRAWTLIHFQKILNSWFKVDSGTKNDIGGEIVDPKMASGRDVFFSTFVPNNIS